MVVLEECEEVVLDTSYLDIGQTTVDGEKVKARVDPRSGSLGAAMHIPISKDGKARKAGEKFKVVIEYSTTKECTALGWLTTE